MTKLTETVMQKIEREHILPVPIWNFRIIQIFKWGLLVLSALLASLFTALALHIIFEIDWEAFLHLGITRYQAILASLPFLWFGLILFFFFSSVIFSRQTKHGYRYTYGLLSLVFFIISASMGIALEKTRYDEPVERFFFSALPKYDWGQKILPSSEKQWLQPENGLLGGSVTTVNQEQSTLEMEDLKKNEWEVNFQNAKIEEVDLKPKTQINIIGNQEDDDHFQATIIRQPKTPQKKESENWDEKEDDSTQISGDHENEEPEEEDNEGED